MLACGAAVKLSPKTRVSLVQAPTERGPRTVCVKEYLGQPLWKNLRNLFRRRPAIRSWAAAHALLVRGAEVALHLAARVPRNPLASRSSFVISAALQGAIGVDRYITAKLDASARRRAFAAALGRHFRSLHEAGVCHRDLKASNILVTEEGPDAWRFYLVDLDRVRFMEPVDRRRRALNLAQVNASTPLLMSATDRLRFFVAYRDRPKLSADDKALIAFVVELTSDRQCIWDS